MGVEKKKVEYLVVDTTAFIQNAPLHEITQKAITCQEVVNEITNSRQLRRLITLPYDLEVKEVYPENVKIVSDFALSTGDYRSLSATDIKVIALTYQLEKEKVGTEHIRTKPLARPEIKPYTKPKDSEEVVVNLPGFYMPKRHQKKISESNTIEENYEKQESESDVKQTETVDNDKNETEELDSGNQDEEDDDGWTQIISKKTKKNRLNSDSKSEINEDDILSKIVEKNCNLNDGEEYDDEDDDDDEEDNEEGWITPENLDTALKNYNCDLVEDKNVTVACMTTDFAMQNVLKQMNLNVAALDGRMIKQLRTFILRCYSCFKLTSIMTLRFCPKCGNDTLKKVSAQMNNEGKLEIFINAKKPLSGRGKKYSIPKIKGGKHPNNPILVADQPMPHNMPTKMGRTKTNALDEDYLAGFSPFAMRDVTSKAAQLKIRPGMDARTMLRRNPNEVRRKRK